MTLFRKNVKGGQHFVIIFDIGSASIGGSFVCIEHGKIPEIIFLTRRDIPFQEKLNFQRFLESMIKTLEEMFVEIKKAGGNVHVDRAFCVLASPWYASQTRLVHYNQQVPFTVTEKGLSKLIQKEIELFRDSKLFARSKVGNDAPEIMESKNIQMKLNGYEVRNPFEKKTSELEIALYISMIPANIHQLINHSIRKFWHVPDAHFSSFSFVTFDVIRDIFTDVSTLLFMDISGEVTDISIAKDNVLLESITFPAGKNMLIRSLIAGMKSNPSSAASELELYLAHQSTPEHSAQIEKILRVVSREWLVFFENALMQLSKEFPIPRTIFFTADDSVVKWFEQSIHETHFSKFSQEDGVFVTRSLGNAFLGKFVKVLEPEYQDPFLAIETIFANKMIGLGVK